MLLWPRSSQAKEDPTKILCTFCYQSGVGWKTLKNVSIMVFFIQKFHWFCRAWWRQAYSDDFFRERKVQRRGGKGRPLIRLMRWAAVCPYKGVWLHGRVPVGSVHALSSGLRGGKGSVSTMHTDRWESSQREAVLYLSICLLDRRSGFISTVAMCEGRGGRCFNWDQWS